MFSIEPDLDERTIQFQPGKLGIASKDWENGYISTIIKGGQAENLGVKVHWKLLKIDGYSYSETTLDDYLAKNQPFSITFGVSKVTLESSMQLNIFSTSMELKISQVITLVVGFI